MPKSSNTTPLHLTQQHQPLRLIEPKQNIEIYDQAVTIRGRGKPKAQLTVMLWSHPDGKAKQQAHEPSVVIVDANGGWTLDLIAFHVPQNDNNRMRYTVVVSPRDSDGPELHTSFVYAPSEACGR